VSTEQWRAHLDRFRRYDPWVSTIVVLALVALIAHEGTAIVTGRVPFASSNGDGPYGRVLLGVIVTASAFWTRQTRKDVLTDVTVTTEVRDRMSTLAEVVPSQETDVDKLIAAMKAERLAAEAVIQANHARERHKLEGRVGIAEQDARDQREQTLKWEMQSRDLADKLARCAESHIIAGPRGEKGDKGEPGDKPC
jgi:hypothetical protein